jgi:mannose-6-phosphate isomerase-like protein (cupin superfamily)
VGDVDIDVVDLSQKLASVTQHWAPKTVADLNDHDIKVVKLAGEFVWHAHEHADELFLVLAGQMTIQFRDGEVLVGPGQIVVVPRGVEHRPVADEEVHAVLIEPRGTVNTGDAGGPLTATPEAL